MRKKEPAFTELPKVTGEDEAAVYYTSGSTGQPKGAILHHIVFGTILDSSFCSDPQEYPGLEDWQILQCTSKLPYIASLLCLDKSFLIGRTLLLTTEQEQGSPERLASAMERHRPDVMVVTPSVILNFMEQPAFAGAFANLKHVILCGERLIPSTVQRISQGTKGRLSTAYGSSEMMNCAEYRYRKDGKIHLGKATYGVCLYLLDERLAEILPGEEGELFIGGIPAKYGHYLNRPDLDEEKYLEHPRFGSIWQRNCRFS